MVIKKMCINFLVWC